MKNNACAHACLFVGPEHVGKTTLAHMFAYDHLSEKTSINTKETTRKHHPDIMFLSPETEEKKGVTKEKDISIQSVRDVLHKLALTPYQAHGRMLIVEQAHKLTTQAQNILLKTLEEPSLNTYIILVTHEEKKLLPTIHSRVHHYRFSLLPKEQLGVDEEIAQISFGRPGVATLLKKDKEKYAQRKDQEIKLHELSSLNTIERLHLAEEFAKNIPDAIETFQTWIALSHQTWEETHAMRTLATTAKLQKTIEILTTTNTNPRLAIENMMMSL